jgi:hypothetical protein
MKALLRFDLDDPDDERQHRYALAGRDALIALEVISPFFAMTAGCVQWTPATAAASHEPIA